ncbi:MAG: response regulator transcription factor [Catenulispora sp.]
MAFVLIADDDPAIRDLVAFQLHADGHECLAVEDGAAALAAMRERAPDLAILDVSMPGLSGFEVCRALRADPALAGLPVLVLTASVRGSDVTQGFASGADDYVVKPFKPRELSERVRAILDRAAGFPIF